MKKVVVALLVFVALICIHGKTLIAQDAILSQFFASPVYLNPAFAGSLDGTRAVMNVRSHPLPDASSISTLNVSVDTDVPALYGGLGLLVTSDYQGNLMWDNLVSAIYAYHFRINREWYASFGAQAGFFRRDLRWSNLEFLSPGQQPPPYEAVNAFDVSAGALAYNDWLYGGIALHHLTQPSVSLLDENARLDLKYTAHLGLYIEPGSNGRSTNDDAVFFVSPNIIYQGQGPFDRINYGMYVGVDRFVAGAWFRQDLDQSNTMVFLVGMDLGSFQVGYSYDHSFSGFTDVFHSVHEISISYRVVRKEGVRGILRCPEF